MKGQMALLYTLSVKVKYCDYSFDTD